MPIRLVLRDESVGLIVRDFGMKKLLIILAFNALLFLPVQAEGHRTGVMGLGGGLATIPGLVPGYIPSLNLRLSFSPVYFAEVYLQGQPLPLRFYGGGGGVRVALLNSESFSLKMGGEFSYLLGEGSDDGRTTHHKAYYYGGLLAGVFYFGDNLDRKYGALSVECGGGLWNGSVSYWMYGKQAILPSVQVFYTYYLF